jgi:hypothetical protein
MRAIMIVALIVAVIAPVVSHDARLPQPGQLNIALANSFMTLPGRYDADGSYQAWDKINLGFSRSLFLGIALELGVLDWMSVGIDYSRGWIYWSWMYTSDTITFNQLFDLLLEVKFRLVGEKGPLVHDRLRVAASPVVQIPMPGPDWKKETDNVIAGKAYTGSDIGTRSFGLGGRMYMDVLFSDWFSLSSYGEFVNYFPIEKASLMSGGTGAVKDSYEYGFGLVCAGGPRFSFDPGLGFGLTASLPLRLSVNPRSIKNGTNQADGRHKVYLEPGVSARFKGLPLPLEAELAYLLPIVGRGDLVVNGAGSAYADHIITLTLRTDLKIF